MTDDRRTGPFEHDAELKEAFEAVQRNDLKFLDYLVAKYRRSALAKAEAGDLSELKALVRSGVAMNEQERARAEESMGKAEARKGAPRNHDLTLKISLAYFWLHEVDGMKYEAAVSQIMRLVDKGRSTVASRIMEGRNCAITRDQLEPLRSAWKFLPPEVIKYFRQLHLESG